MELKFKSQKSTEEAQVELFKVSKRKLPASERVCLLQEKLYCKAKQERDYKFYILYDKLFIPYMLSEAYKSVKSKGGSSGVDGINFSDIEKSGLENFLHKLSEDLRKQTYRPQAVKRVWIEKANGGQRPLGIPTIRDRVAQTVCKMVLEPIFEADFEDSSYGFRPERSSKDAMKEIKENLQKGMTEVYDADLSSYFDTIPHDKLKIVLQKRISDPRVLQLIDKWLKCPVYEDGQYKGGKKQTIGTPQGGVISPLLANIYMHLVDKIVNDYRKLFYQQGIRIIRYADDFVLMGKQITQHAIEKLKNILQRMGLSLNEQKTKLIQSRNTSFNFLGFTIRYDKDLKGRNKRYWNIFPSNKSENNIRSKIKDFLHRSGHYAPEKVSKGLNVILHGWFNYFQISGVSYTATSKRTIRFYLQNRLYKYYNRKSQRKSRLYGQHAFKILEEKYQLINPAKYLA